jgi:hypothetical protein
VFKELSARLDEQLAALDRLASTELAALNSMLAKKKVEPIKDGVPPSPLQK